MTRSFRLQSDYAPTGDQPQAIEDLVQRLDDDAPGVVLLGVTGSGKTFTMANVIERLNRPTLVISHNKTLAAQLYSEFKALFPDNAVSYFVSYYDYYQPEAYLPATDTYIEKDALVNDEIDRLRHGATMSLSERRDVIIVASVSCIYGLGESEEYTGMALGLKVGMTLPRDELLEHLVTIQYNRNEMSFERGTFRVRGDSVEVFPAYEEEAAVRIEFFGDEVEEIRRIDPLRGRVLESLDELRVYPASHYVTSEEKLRIAIRNIRTELDERLRVLKSEGKLLEHQRLEERTMYDLEMLEQMGFVSGIENYSRHLTGREPGRPPPTLLDFFPDDKLVIIDESHVTIPQVAAMYKSDRSRKENLVGYGFRLPSALDNRPLMFEEFEAKMGQVVYVTATPADYELRVSEGAVVEQIIRPTGLVDPEVSLRPVAGQVDDLLARIREVTAGGGRVLVTTLTKRMAEDLTDYYRDVGVKVTYLHSDVDTLERIKIIHDLRAGVYDVIVGINLLREGLDIPEVSLVAILDADKEGFLRSTRALIQTIGRAARNAEGRVILYADVITPSIQRTLDETNRRRTIQMAYNEAHGITPTTVERPVVPMVITEVLSGKRGGGDRRDRRRGRTPDADARVIDATNVGELEAEVARLDKEMREHVSTLAFEEAARVRDEMLALKQMLLYLKK